MHRHFLAYCLAGLVMLTNVGIPVSIHVCQKMGTAYASVLSHNNTCCEKKKAEKHEGACHPAAVTIEPGIQSQPCCKDYSDFVKMKSEFLSGLSFDLVKKWQQMAAVQTVTFPLADFQPLSQLSLSFQPHAPPLPLYGRSLLVFKQTLRC